MASHLAIGLGGNGCRLPFAYNTRGEDDVPRLTVRGPTGPPVLYELADETVTIGRSASNTLVVFDPLVSREHARIQSDGAEWGVEDLRSRNGTRLNGVRIDGKRVLEPGDAVAVGCVVIALAAADHPSSDETPLAESWLP